MSARNLFGENLYALVVEGGKATEEGIQDAAESPHVDGFRVALVADDFGRGVADGAAGGHGLVVPDDLGEAKVGDFDAPDTAAAESFDEFAFVFFVLISGLVDFRVFGGDEGDGFKEEVLGFDVAVVKVSILILVKQRNGGGGGRTDVPRPFLRGDI